MNLRSGLLLVYLQVLIQKLYLKDSPVIICRVRDVRLMFPVILYRSE